MDNVQRLKIQEYHFCRLRQLARFSLAIASASIQVSLSSLSISPCSPRRRCSRKSISSCQCSAPMSKTGSSPSLASSSFKEKSSSLILSSDGIQPKDAAGSRKWKCLQTQMPTTAKRPYLLRLDAIGKIHLIPSQIHQGSEVHRIRATGSSAKLQNYFNNDKSDQGDKGKKRGRTREIHTDSTERAISKANR